MAKFRFPRSLKPLAKLTPQLGRWLHPALLGSVGLHLLLLLLPLPDWSRFQSVAEPEVEPMSEPLSKRAADTQVQITPLPSPSPASVATPRPSPSPVAATPRLSPTLPALVPQPAPPSPVPRATPPKAPPVSPSPAASPAPPVPAVPPPALPFADLPLLAGAQTGCFGLGTCREITDGTPFRSAGQALEKQLASQGYTVTPREDYDEAGRKVYQLTKGSETRYLNVLSADVGSTVYLVTPQPISLSDLQNSGAIQVELTSLLDQTPSTPALLAQFFQPDAFWLGETVRPETGGRLRLVAGRQPDQLLGSLTAALQAQGFSLVEAGGYGSGLLYEVTKGPYTGYLNLVPAADQTGTIVVLWSRLPD
ncbi:MAG: hypothetical protein ACKO7W_01955 [Elainella sp.]